MATSLKVQDFLRSGGTLAELTANLGIIIKSHPIHPELVHLSYNILESPKGDPIVTECRGIILNSQDDWKVIAHPFDRFANYGEGWTAPIDWETARVQDKLDGSLMYLWNYKRVWYVSTKGSPDAGGNVGDFPFTFAELFWKTMKEKYSFCHADLVSVGNLFATDFTYMFELMSIYNRVVCSYGIEPQLALLGVRDVVTNEELPVDDFVYIGVPVVKSYPLKTVNDVMAAAEVLDPMKNEGFVVVDQHFNRCKIKSPSYVMIHHMKDGMSQRRIIRLIQLGEESEVLIYLPEYTELVDKIKTLINTTIHKIEYEFGQIKHITDRKAFALEATKSDYAGVLFALFLGKTTNVKNYILNSKKKDGNFQFSEENIERMIGLR